MDKRRKPYPTKAKERIDATMIIDKLRAHIKGELELKATQINAARILLNKALPDLKAVEHSGDIGSKTAEEMTRDELLRIAAAGSAGDSKPGRSTNKPAVIH